MKFIIEPYRYFVTMKGGRQWAGFSIWFEDSLIFRGASPTLPNAYTPEKVILVGLLDGLVRFSKRTKTYPLDIVTISVPAPIKDTIGHGETFGEPDTHAISVTILTLIDRLIGSGAKVTFYTPDTGER